MVIETVQYFVGTENEQNASALLQPFSAHDGLGQPQCPGRNDVHPMGYLRINCTLQQYDEFLNFYGITEGDGMYLAPEDRVAIW